MKTDNWSPSCSQIPVGFLPPGPLAPFPLLERAGSWPVCGKEVSRYRHKAEDGLCCCPLEPSAPPGMGTQLPLVFTDCATKCHHCVLVRGRFSAILFFVWNIIHGFFLNLSTFLYSFPIQLFSYTFFFHHLPCFHYSISPSCYILRICGQLPSGRTNCQWAHSVCKSFCKDCIGTLTFILIAPCSLQCF